VSESDVEVSEKLPTARTIDSSTAAESTSDKRASLVKYAKQFVGNPYVWGGTSLTKGADCSGFTLSVYAHYGISLPHSSSAQSGYGKKIKASNAQPGDLFFYGSGKSINHVAIYIGNGKIVHAANSRDGIKISNAYYSTPICVVSLFN
jgi:cell wall-associated NlpC family hydrolase